MGDCRRAGKPSRYVTSRLGQLSLPSLWGKSIDYRPIWLGLRRRAFSCVGWQVTLCDPIRQVTLSSFVTGFFYKELYRTFNFLIILLWFV